MAKRLMQAAVGLVVIFAVAQFIRPEGANPPIDPSQAFEAQMGTAHNLAPIVDRACRSYLPQRQRDLLAAMCSELFAGRMPGAQQADREPSR